MPKIVIGRPRCLVRTLGLMVESGSEQHRWLVMRVVASGLHMRDPLDADDVTCLTIHRMHFYPTKHGEFSYRIKLSFNASL